MVKKEELKELREKAKQELDSGKTIPEVGTELLKKGYKREEVDEILGPYIPRGHPKRLAIFSLIWGLVGFLFLPLFFLPVATGIGAILFGLRSRSKEVGGLWKVGTLLGLLSILLHLALLFGMFFF